MLMMVPVRILGKAVGSITRRMVCLSVAPNARDASLNQQRAQVGIATATDAAEHHLAAGTKLARRQPHPGRALPAVAEIGGIAERSDDRVGGNRTDTG